MIAFTADVMVDDINDISFMPSIETVPGDADLGRNCWCEIRGTAFGVKLEIPCEPPRPGQPLDVVPAGGTCNAAVYFIAPDVMKKLLRAGRGRSLRIRVQFNGDLVRESINSAGALRQLAVDANHLPPWVPNRKSGDGIEGGMFDSWLRLKGD